MAMTAGRPFRATATGDILTTGPGSSQNGVLLGAKLTSGGAASTAQLVDANLNVLVDLACPVGGADYADIPMVFVGKVTLQTLTGAGAVVNIWVQ